MAPPGCEGILSGRFQGKNSERILELFSGEIILTKHIDISLRNGGVSSNGATQLSFGFGISTLFKAAGKMKVVPAGNAVFD